MGRTSFANEGSQIVLRTKRKAGCPQIGHEEVVRKDLKETRTCWEGLKRKTLNRLVWRKNVCRFVALWWPGAKVNC